MLVIRCSCHMYLLLGLWTRTYCSISCLLDVTFASCMVVCSIFGTRQTRGRDDVTRQGRARRPGWDGRLCGRGAVLLSVLRRRLEYTSNMRAPVPQTFATAAASASATRRIVVSRLVRGSEHAFHCDVTLHPWNPARQRYIYLYHVSPPPVSSISLSSPSKQQWIPRTSPRVLLPTTPSTSARCSSVEGIQAIVGGLTLSALPRLT